MQPKAPRQTLGKYEPLLELASGGMATVYAARQVGVAGFERLVVVKRVHAHLVKNQEFYNLFREEARLAALLRHPNVVPVIDVAEVDEELLLVMEYVEGASLFEVLRSGHSTENLLAPSLISRVLHDTLAGLHAAHETCDMRGNPLKIVHRDVSPQNILLSVDGVTRLIDFGVAKAAHSQAHTQTGALKGKLCYLSPEQVAGEPLDGRADVFSAGVVLHEALTGRQLFGSGNELDSLLRILELEIPPPSQFRDDCPVALDSVVAKALARKREERYPTAADFAQALEAACPPASPRQVAEALEERCGEKLASRRSALQAILQEDFSQDSAATPAPAAPSSLPVVATTDSTLSSSLENKPPVAQRKPWLLASALALLGTTIALLLWRSLDAKPPLASDSASLSYAPVPTPCASVADSSVAPRVVRITAQATIESVRAEGLRAVTLDGTQAELTLAPEPGDTLIEATLSNGKIGRVRLSAESPKELPLVYADSRPDKGTVKGGIPAKPAPAGPSASARLHRNPYEALP